MTDGPTGRVRMGHLVFPIVFLSMYFGNILLRVAYALAAGSDASLDGLTDKILSECGAVSGVLCAGIGYLAIQNAKSRAGWEKDRSDMMQVNSSLSTALGSLSVAHGELRGIVLTLQAKRD